MTDYSKLKVTELKGILKERGIPSTGLSRKQQIIDALEARDVASGGDEAATDARRDGEGESVSEDVQQVGHLEENGVEAAGVAATQVEDEGKAAGGDEAVEKDGVEAVPPPVQSTPTTTEDVQAPEATADEPAANPTPTEVTVMEKNEPVSQEPSTLATPQQLSPAAESQSSEMRKRKRRSPTPPPSAETVNKKLKSAGEELVKLAEDVMVMEDAPVPVVDGEQNIVVPYSTSDDIVNDPPSTADEQQEEEERSVEPAIHPATHTLYIRDLVRPLQPNQLREHLLALSTPSTSSPSSSTITTFHLDTLRTHAFVTFTSLAAAAHTRSALHNRIWPDEPARKPLWVDFVPEEKVGGWIEMEDTSSGSGGGGGGGGRRDAKKWEVVYTNTTTSEAGVEATLQDVSSAAPAAVQRQPRLSNSSQQGQGMPNAPLGPRSALPPISANPNPSAKPSPAPPPTSESFSVLDQRFASTTTKPKLYFLPVGKEVVDRRLNEFESWTSQEWKAEGGSRSRGDGGNDGGGRDGGAGRGGFGEGGELRRYTFEDGDRLVDGGPDIGSFGRGGRMPPYGGSGGGRGRGGGGRWRGRR